MLILRDHSPIPPHIEKCVVALGNFDGLHIGHRHVIDTSLAVARKNGHMPLVLTFEPHPRRVFNPSLPPLRIISFSEKARLLRDMGIEGIRVIRFTRAFSTMTAEAFINGILAGQLRASHIVTGNDFIFGHNRQGNVEYLKKMTTQAGFAYTPCEQVLLGGERCSSTRIRELLAQGKVEALPPLLGRDYGITGIVRAGEKRGRTLGFPTANVLPGRIFTPAKGIYAVKLKAKGRMVDGVASLGTRPTFDDGHLLLETHIFDWNESLYGEHVEVFFIRYLREERKYASIEALKKQMAEDCANAKHLLKSLPSHNNM